MFSFHIFHIILYLTVFQPSTAAFEDRSAGESCDYLVGHVFQQKCIGLYTATMMAKYMDGKMQRLNQFAIYTAERDENIYLLALRKSVLHLCQRIQWVNETEFECMDKATPKPILLLAAELHCFEVKLGYCVDLVTLCELENHRKPVFPEIKHNAILYAIRSILSEAGAAFVQPWSRLSLLGICVFISCALKLLGKT